MDGDRENDQSSDSSLMQDVARRVAVFATGYMYWKYCRVLRWLPRRLAERLEKKLMKDLIACVAAAVSDVVHIHRVTIRPDGCDDSLPRPSRN
jgi:hypothetical protein